jgi:hypothetical protein
MNQHEPTNSKQAPTLNQGANVLEFENEKPGKISTNSMNSMPTHRKAGGFAPGHPWRFQPGQSGNPKGRPPRAKPKLVSDVLRDCLAQPCPDAPKKSYAEVIGDSILKAASAGEIRAIVELLDRTEGKARQAAPAGPPNPLLSEEWALLRDTIADTLERFPDAKAAVLEALEQNDPNGDYAVR